jgi:hypothetical protein
MVFFGAELIRSNSSYAIVDTDNIRGSWKQVANLASMFTLSFDKIKEGQPVYVVDTDGLGTPGVFILTDYLNRANINGWTALSLGGGTVDWNDVTNKPVFYSSVDFNNDFGTKSTDDLVEGSTNKYATGNEFQKTTDTLDDITTGVINVHLTAALKFDYDDAATKRHTQNTDTKLAENTADEISAISLVNHINDTNKHRYLWTTNLNDSLTVTNPIGNIKNTETVAILKTKSWWKIVEDLLFETILSFISFPKEAFLTRSGVAVYEVGTTLQLILTAAFNKGQITTGDNNVVNLVGDPTDYIFTGAGITVSHTETTNVLSNVQHTTNNFLVTQGSMTWNVQVDHDAETAAYNDSTGTPETALDAQRVAGNSSASISLIGRYKIFYGGGSAIPTSSNDVRNLSSFVWENVNTVNFNTGNTNNIFTIAIPATKNLVSVINLTNNVNLTGTFILDNTLVQIEDANGDLVNYKVYHQVMTIPYTNSQNYQFQFS